MYEAKHAPKLIARNTAIQVLGRIAFLALSLINFKIIAVYLGPTIFGDYGNVFNYTALFTVLTDFGLFTVAVREIAKAPKRRQEIMENVISLRLCVALLATALAIGIAFFLAYLMPNSGYPHILQAIEIGALSMLIYFISNMLDVVFHIEMKMSYVALVELIGKIVAVAAAAVAIMLHAGFLWIVAGVVFGNLAGMIARFLTARKFFKIRFGFNWEVWRWLLSMAIPLGIIFALNNLYFKVDSIMLYVMSGSFNNGIYTAAYRVLETTIFVSAFFVQAMTPYLSNYLINKKETARQLILVGSEVMLATGAIISLAIAFYAPEIILLLSGPAYLPAVYPLIILSLVLTFLYINSLLGQVLVLLDRRNVLLVVSALILLINIVLNYFLIPKFAFIGAAASTLLCEALLLAMNYLIMRAQDLLTLRASSIGRILLTVFAAYILFILARSANIYWIIPFFTVPVIYFGLLWRQGIIPLGVLFGSTNKT